MLEPKNAPEKLQELPEATRKFLAGLRPDEVEALKVVVAQPADDIKVWFKMVRDIRTVGRFGYWLVVTVVSIFIGTVVLYKYILKAWGFLKGGPQ